MSKAAEKRKEVIADLNRTADRLELIVQILEARIATRPTPAPPKETPS